MKVLVGYLIDGKFNGIDRYLMTMISFPIIIMMS